MPPEQGDQVNTDSKFVYMGCSCQGGYTGRFCDSDIDACEMNGQPCYAGVECIDLPPPANSSGYKCGPCPSGYTGNGAQCVGEFYMGTYYTVRLVRGPITKIHQSVCLIAAAVPNVF